MLLRGGDEAGAAQPQHDHDGQEEAGGQNPPREAGAPAGARRAQIRFEAFQCVQRGDASVSPGHAAEEVVLSRGVLCVLDGVLAFPARLTCRPLSVTPHPYGPTERVVRYWCVQVPSDAACFAFSPWGLWV